MKLRLNIESEELDRIIREDLEVQRACMYDDDPIAKAFDKVINYYTPRPNEQDANDLKSAIDDLNQMYQYHTLETQKQETETQQTFMYGNYDTIDPTQIEATENGYKVRFK